MALKAELKLALYSPWFNEIILIIQAQRTNLKRKRKDRQAIMQVRSRECQLFTTMLIVDQSWAGEKLSLNICCETITADNI